MSRRARRKPTENLISNCGDLRIRKPARQIAEEYERLAEEAKGEKDTRLAETYLQHAEFYKKKESSDV